MNTKYLPLQEYWTFPSDHLPIGVQVSHLRFISWNVLNTHAISWIVTKDTQGLKRSLIGKENVYERSEDSITIRDYHVIKLVKCMCRDDIAAIALQECSHEFLVKLVQSLPENWTLVRIAINARQDDQVATLYNANLLRETVDSRKSHRAVFSVKPQRVVLSLSFVALSCEVPFSVRVINAHLPGKPGNPAPDEFASYVLGNSNETDVTVAMGDMNETPPTMKKAFQDAGAKKMKVFHPYNTNVSPDTYAPKAIDHAYVLEKIGDLNCTALTSGQILPNDADMESCVDLLNTYAPNAVDADVWNRA
jgi:endonuclease/exonuclease/phosphatase family metal-dependent hydrolase